MTGPNMIWRMTDNTPASQGLTIMGASSSIRPNHRNHCLFRLLSRGSRSLGFFVNTTSHAWLEVNRYQPNASLEHGVSVSCENAASQVIQRMLHAFWCQLRRLSQHRLELRRHARTDVQWPCDRHTAPVCRMMLAHDLCALEGSRPATFARPALRSRHLLGSWQMCLLESPKVAVRNCVKHQLSRFPRSDVGSGNCPGCFLMRLTNWESFSNQNLGEGFKAWSFA